MAPKLRTLVDTTHSDPRLVQPLCRLLGAFDDPGQRILSGGAAESAPDLEAGDFQHGPGLAIYEHRLHGTFGKA